MNQEIKVGDNVTIEDPKHLFNGRIALVTDIIRETPIVLELRLIVDGSERCVMAMGRYCNKVSETPAPICQNAIEDNAGEPIEVGSYVCVEDEESEYYGAQGEVVKILGCEAQVAVVGNGNKFLRKFRGSQLEKILGPIEKTPAAAHTPGPWTADHLHVSAKGRGGHVGQAFVVKNYKDITFEPIEDVEADANAKLFAAAPDLLEALRAARSLIKSTGVTEESRIGGKILKEINQAISKATL